MVNANEVVEHFEKTKIEENRTCMKTSISFGGVEMLVAKLGWRHHPPQHVLVLWLKTIHTILVVQTTKNNISS